MNLVQITTSTNNKALSSTNGVCLISNNSVMLLPVDGVMAYNYYDVQHDLQLREEQTVPHFSQHSNILQS